MEDRFPAAHWKFPRNSRRGLGAVRLRSPSGFGPYRLEAESAGKAFARARRRLSSCKQWRQPSAAICLGLCSGRSFDRSIGGAATTATCWRSTECIAPESCTGSTRRWTSRRKPPRSACGTSWLRKFCFSAAFFSLTPSTAINFPPPSASAAICWTWILASSTQWS